MSRSLDPCDAHGHTLCPECQMVDDLRLQIEQEREKYQQAMMDWADDSLKAFVEIKRLREALARISSGEVCSACLCSCECHEYASDALNVGKE